ncbi:hypothetical protein, partial [Acinetobacter baumannii]|uniref:hypothetical protein n=1 Tax=Acinetobacter baumannii TaxID=470 RepID=UPI001AEC7716
PASNESLEISSFSILFDNKKVIIGSLDPLTSPSAVETKHPALVQEVKLAIRHDKFMSKIKQDFGEAIKNKYGTEFFNDL